MCWWAKEDSAYGLVYRALARPPRRCSVKHKRPQTEAAEASPAREPAVADTPIFPYRESDEVEAWLIGMTEKEYWATGPR